MSPEDLQQLLLASFADEAREQLQRVGNLLSELEDTGADESRELLDQALREAHNLKGAARAAELHEVEALAHQLEGLLNAIGEGELRAFEFAGLTVQRIGELVHATRAQPDLQARLGAFVLFDGLARLVDDLARRLRKDAALTVVGSDAALDEHLLARLRAPLTHMVRNCLDHGVELPAARVAAGKPRAGRVSITLVTHAKNHQLVVEVADDGAGIDRERVRMKAVELGIVSAESVDRMSDEDVLSLIFHPGLSTSEDVTTLSGRGVGMDAVRERVAALGGRIEVESTPGLGTTLTLRVPVA